MLMLCRLAVTGSAKGSYQATSAFKLDASFSQFPPFIPSCAPSFSPRRAAVLSDRLGHASA